MLAPSKYGPVRHSIILDGSKKRPMAGTRLRARISWLTPCLLGGRVAVVRGQEFFAATGGIFLGWLKSATNYFSILPDADYSQMDASVPCHFAAIGSARLRGQCWARK